MINSILQTFVDIFGNVVGWFNNITSSTGTYVYILAVIFAALAIRFIVYPFLKDGVK